MPPRFLQYRGRQRPYGPAREQHTASFGRVLILFEKVRAPDARFQDMATALYSDFKTEQGFSDVEILSKSRSLRGVLEPFSSGANIGLLQRAGFIDIWPIMKYICFEGFVAIK